MKKNLYKLTVLEKLYFAVCFLFLAAAPAKAYIDPSVATYAVQVVAGLAVAVGAVAGVYLRKLRRKFYKKMGIDENANKEVEPDIEVYY